MRHFICLIAALAGSVSLFATPTVRLAVSLPSPQPLGTRVTVDGIGSDTDAGTLDYQFSVAYGTHPSQIVQDYDISNLFMLVATLHEGTYTVSVVARNTTTLNTATTSVSYAFTSRVTGGVPVAHSTANPLVALFSAPGCPSGSSMYVKFATTGVPTNRTSAQSCTPSLSMNFYVAGMLASTTYQLTPITVTGSTSTPGPTVSFTTGAIPAGIVFPAMTTPRPVDANTDLGQSVLLLDPIGQPSAFYVPYAVNLQSQVIWYYPGLANTNQSGSFGLRPLPGGNMLVILNDTNTAGVRGQILREIDLAGNTVRQTSVTRLNEVLLSQGKVGITDVDHDAIRLPNGHTLVIAAQEELFPEGTQPPPPNSPPGPVDIIGDAILDLDQNLQIAWSWSAYDHLDITRAAILGESCPGGGCPPIFLAPSANDWLHGNSLNYVPQDGNVLISLRHQDWVAKIDYNNGVGSGNVLWELGHGGNFTITGPTTFPWFSHQHDVEFELNSTNFLSVFDNGNTRVAQDPSAGTDSRGMYLDVNQSNFSVNVLLSADLGVYSAAVGSAQLLDNGNFYFEAGVINFAYGQSIEVLPNATLNYTLQDQDTTYRGYRMDSLYLLDAKSN